MSVLRQPAKRVVVLGLWPAAVISLVVGIWWGVALYLSSAFWQWLTGVGIIIYLRLITVLLPADVSMTTARSAVIGDSNPR